MGPKPLDGRAAIVTGGGTGIGRAIALALAQNGASVALASRTESHLRAVQQEIEAFGGTAVVFPTDVGDASQCMSLVRQAVERFGRLDVLVNNAVFSAGTGKPLADTPLEEWESAWAVNVRGPFVLCREAIPHLRQQERAFIVNLISMAARRHLPYTGVYVATKNALRSMSIVLSKELREQTGIRVHLLNPGGVLTAPMQRAIETGRRADLRGTKMMIPEEIAEVVLFLVTRTGNAVIDEVSIRRVDATYFGTE